MAESWVARLTERATVEPPAAAGVEAVVLLRPDGAVPRALLKAVSVFGSGAALTFEGGMAVAQIRKRSAPLLLVDARCDNEEVAGAVRALRSGSVGASGGQSIAIVGDGRTAARGAVDS